MSMLSSSSGDLAIYIIAKIKCDRCSPAMLIRLSYYSSTCHERTPSGPGKSVRTLQVAARHRDGRAGG